MSQLLEVTEYRYLKTGVNSTFELNNVGSIEIVPSNVIKVNWETEDSEGNNNRFKVYMTDERTFITDWNGVSDIQNWDAPFRNNN